MKRPILLVAISLLILGACRTDSGKNGVELHKENGHSFLYVDLDQATDTIDFNITNLVDSCQLIRLENSKEATIDRISQISFSKDRIYVYNQEHYIMAFDWEGKYREQIGNLGQGPFEYIYINNMAVGGDPAMILGQPHHIKDYLLFDTSGKGRTTITRRLDGLQKVMITENNEVIEIGYPNYPYQHGDSRNIMLCINSRDGQLRLEKNPLYQAECYHFLPLSFYRFDDHYRVHFSRDTLFDLNTSNGLLSPVAVFTASVNGINYQQLEKEISSGSKIMCTEGKVYIEVHAETSEYYLIREMKKHQDKDGYAVSDAISYFCIDKKRMKANPVRLIDPFWGMDLNRDRGPIMANRWKIVDNRYGVLAFQGIELKDELEQRLKDRSLPPTVIARLQNLDRSVSQDDNEFLFVYHLKNK